MISHMEDKAIRKLLQSIQDMTPNVPVMVTFGMNVVNKNLRDLHEKLSTPENQHLADEVAECIGTLKETWEEIEGGYNALAESQGKSTH